MLQTPHGDTARLCPHGAHLTSWRTADGMEHLFLSRRAEFREDAAIRGGVPIIFPQFAGLGVLPKHGFARTARWLKLSNDSADSVRLRWQDSEATRAIWPQQFVAEYALSLETDALCMQLSIRNTGVQTFTFTAALHTYLRVQDIAEVSVVGLQGLRYRNSAAGDAEAHEAASALRIDGEVDRIYFATAEPIQVLESGQPIIVCSAVGFTDTVVWNPGAAKAATLTDLEPEGYRQMLCIEAAVIEHPVQLQPGESWQGMQRLASMHGHE
jgi:glucose-6-phosphate 1-epimerase